MEFELCIVVDNRDHSQHCSECGIKLDDGTSTLYHVTYDREYCAVCIGLDRELSIGLVKLIASNELMPCALRLAKELLADSIPL